MFLEVRLHERARCDDPLVRAPGVVDGGANERAAVPHPFILRRNHRVEQIHPIRRPLVPEHGETARKLELELAGVLVVHHPSRRLRHRVSSGWLLHWRGTRSPVSQSMKLAAAARDPVTASPEAAALALYTPGSRG